MNYGLELHIKKCVEYEVSCVSTSCGVELTAEVSRDIFFLCLL